MRAYDSLRAAIDLRFKSGNSVSIERAHITSDEWQSLCDERNALQARIDALMLEYCPNDMSVEQREEWARHQVPVQSQVIPRLNIRCETTDGKITGTTSLPVIRVEVADDGSFTAVTDYWPSQIAALRQPQQSGAQAVGYGYFAKGSGNLVVVEEKFSGLPHVFRLYTDLPPLPEGVSDEDAKAALAAMDAVLVELTGLYGVEKLSEDHQAELLRGIRAALENFLARLAARGEKGVQS